jgi:hypothetical protein
MQTRRLIGPCLAVLVAAVGAAPAGGQQPANPSHIEVPFTRPPTGQFTDFLKSRDRTRLSDEERAQLEEAFKRDELKNFARAQPEFKDLLDKQDNLHIDDPKAKELLEQFLKRNPSFEGKANVSQPGLPFGLDGETIRRFLNEPRREGGFQPPSGSPPGDELPKSPSPAAGQPMPSGPHNPSRPQEHPRDPSWAERREELRKSFTQILRESPLANSETVRDIGRKLSRSFSEAGEGGMDWDDWLEQMPRLGNWLPRGLPTLPKPDWSARRSAVSAPGMGSLNTPDGGTLSAVVWLAAAVLAAALVWKVLTARRTSGTSSTQPAWKLGPWPVHPGEVATRQDLIHAFEYLSLLIFGPVARAWNHRDIAFRLGEQLGAAGDERRRAADHLAALYERARYAPPADALPDGEAREARRDLCLLAGVAHA